MADPKKKKEPPKPATKAQPMPETRTLTALKKTAPAPAPAPAPTWTDVDDEALRVAMAESSSYQRALGEPEDEYLRSKAALDRRVDDLLRKRAESLEAYNAKKRAEGNLIEMPEGAVGYKNTGPTGGSRAETPAEREARIKRERGNRTVGSQPVKRRYQ